MRNYLTLGFKHKLSNCSINKKETCVSLSVFEFNYCLALSLIAEIISCSSFSSCSASASISSDVARFEVNLITYVFTIFSTSFAVSVACDSFECSLSASSTASFISVLVRVVIDATDFERPKQYFYIGNFWFYSLTKANYILI